MMNKKLPLSWAICLPLLLSATLSVQADTLSDIASRGQLNCGVYADVPPFSSPDPKTRQLVGMDVDLCQALAGQLGVKVNLMPVSVEARIAVLTTGRVDVLIANLAYTKSRAAQIQFSDPYYIAKEVLVVKSPNADKTPADFKGKRLSSTKGSTSEQSIRMAQAKPVTFQDTASAYLALQQNKSVGFVTNGMTATQLVNRAAADNIKLAIIKEPMALEPVAVGMKKGDEALLTKVNAGLMGMEQGGEIDRIWNRWLGPDTEYKMVREEKVQPLSELKFVPLE